MWKSKVKNNTNLWRGNLYRGGFIWGFRDLILRSEPPGVLPPLCKRQLWLCKDFSCPWRTASQAGTSSHLWLWISSQLCWEAAVGAGGIWRLGPGRAGANSDFSLPSTHQFSLLPGNSWFSLGHKSCLGEFGEDRPTQLASTKFSMTITHNEKDALILWEVSEDSFSLFVLIKIHRWQNEQGSHV